MDTRFFLLSGTMEYHHKCVRRIQAPTGYNGERRFTLSTTEMASKIESVLIALRQLSSNPIPHRHCRLLTEPTRLRQNLPQVPQRLHNKHVQEAGEDSAGRRNTFGKYKHSYLKKFGIPGPEAYAIVGHLFPLAYKGMVKFDSEMKKKYGKVVGFVKRFLTNEISFKRTNGTGYLLFHINMSKVNQDQL
ncbi:cytochrome P450 3A8-like [Octopus vulgaris]|uniref:Cytochrome P450 3A8-like n=1 Tax=Octopus vulgaris TaxID=6645 RepID=A0AA36B635_OCTVU|nr:cytochrome P450 3A8-like [Octopus vulgaris]